MISIQLIPQCNAGLFHLRDKYFPCDTVNEQMQEAWGIVKPRCFNRANVNFKLFMLEQWLTERPKLSDKTSVSLPDFKLGFKHPGLLEEDVPTVIIGKLILLKMV